MECVEQGCASRVPGNIVGFRKLDTIFGTKGMSTRTFSEMHVQCLPVQLLGLHVVTFSAACDNGTSRL